MTSVVAFTSTDMINPVVWYGYVASYDSAHITVSDGFLVGTYYGSFSYDVYGNVYGTLTGYKTWAGGTLTLSVTGGSVDAFDFYSAIQSGDAVLATRMVLAGNDSISGSNFDDSLIGYDGKDTIAGGGGSDLVVGGSGADKLSGAVGADLLYGGAGADLLYGGGGADTLFGGSGRDVMNGGIDNARDVFDFNFSSESAVGLLADRVERFAHGVDTIDVSGIDANSTAGGNSAFSFNSTSARAHSIWYVVRSDGIIVRGDVDGNRIADFEIFVADVSSATAGDFVL